MLAIQWIIAIASSAFLLFVYIKHKPLHQSDRRSGRGNGLFDGFAYALRKYFDQQGLFNKIQLPLSILHTRERLLSGSDWTYENTHQKVAQFFGAGLLIIACGAWGGVIAKEELLLVISMLAGAVYATKPFLDAAKKVEQRKLAIITELPDIISGLVLLIGAGESLHQALIKIANARKGVDPLSDQLRRASWAIQHGQTFTTVMEQFNRDCGVQEISLFTSVLLMNYKRGGGQLAMALRELSYSMWEKRKSVARMKGEEASSRLVFPLAAILFVMIIILAAPAAMIML